MGHGNQLFLWHNQGSQNFPTISTVPPILISIRNRVQAPANTSSEWRRVERSGSSMVMNMQEQTRTTTCSYMLPTVRKLQVASANPEDKRFIGDGAPKHFLSWSNSLKWKNFDLSMMFQGAFGFKIFNMRKYGMGLQGSGSDNVLRSAYLDDRDTWSGGGVISSYFLERGDYFKLENVTLGYNFPIKNRRLLDSLRVYVSAKNLFTLTGYSGTDPSAVTSTGITPGVDVSSAYPSATQITLGVTIRFR